MKIGRIHLCILGFSLFQLLMVGKANSQEIFSDISDQLIEYEDSLKVIFNRMFLFNGSKFTTEDVEKKKLNEAVLVLFSEALAEEGSFLYPFDSLKHLGVIYSSDKLVRIITWNLQFSDKSYRYFGFVQKYSDQFKSYLTFHLNDCVEYDETTEYQEFSADKWLGCLIYKVVPIKHKRVNYYILLGWDGNNEFTSKKIIDVLSFNKENVPVFGESVFLFEEGKKKRVVFEYSSKVSMMLRFDEQLNIIVFDHLAPNLSKFKGQYQYYGPDLSHDAFIFEKGKWRFTSDVILTNEEIGRDASKSNSNIFYQPVKEE